MFPANGGTSAAALMAAARYLIGDLSVSAAGDDLDLAHRTQEEATALGYEYAQDAKFPIDRAEFVIQFTNTLANRAENEGRIGLRPSSRYVSAPRRDSAPQRSRYQSDPQSKAGEPMIVFVACP